MIKSLEYTLTNRLRKEDVVSYLKENPNQFDKTINLALSDQHPLAWRSAWLIHHCMEENDERVQAYTSSIIKVLLSKKDGHQRELLKILYKMVIDEDNEGYLFDICMTIWEAVNKSPSVRITAFRFLVKSANKYPELKNEIKFLSQNHYTETLSPGIKHSLKKLTSEVVI